jgi:hypothetical protein
MVVEECDSGDYDIDKYDEMESHRQEKRIQTEPSDSLLARTIHQIPVDRSS